MPTRVGTILSPTLALVYQGRLLWFGSVLIAVLWGILRPEGPSTPVPETWLSSQQFALILHVSAFLALALTARLAFDVRPGWPVWTLLFLAAVALEFLQALLQPESRHFSWLDIGANAFGVILAIMVWPWLREFLRAQ